MMTPVPYPAPNFRLKDEEGIIRCLADYKDSWLVLYFYREDDTPGCTIEACSFRDARDDIVALGAKVVGVSRDNITSHERFKAKHLLNFTLLSDPNMEAIRAYGAWGKKMFGNEGVLRRTFIINPEGTVVKAYGRVVSAVHGQQVVTELQKLQAVKS